jgi:hypothetical protein
MNKPKTRSFANSNTPSQNKNDKFGYSPGKSEGRPERDSGLYKVRFKRKDLEHF